MSIAADITKVVTEDATPEAPPFRISSKATKTKLTFTFIVEASGGLIRAWRARFSPIDRNHGQLIEKHGMVCGSGDVAGPDTFSLAVSSPLEQEVELEESEIGAEPDGEYDVAVYAMSEEDGWSS